MQKSNKAEVSNNLAINIWRRFVLSFREAQNLEVGPLTQLWAGTPFPFWNVIFVNRTAETTSDFTTIVQGASALAALQRQSGILAVCRDVLPDETRERCDAIVGAFGFMTPVAITGMSGEPFPIKLSAPPALRIEQVKDFNEAIRLNCLAYRTPVEFAAASTLGLELANECLIFVASVGLEPVSTATVLIEDGLLYLALVATAEDQREKGYGEAVVRHALQKAFELTGYKRVGLHATEAGKPLYERLGLETDALFTWYLR